ncbi:MAG: RCC1 domain-containing protein, partial [Polyangiales bacterium]
DLAAVQRGTPAPICGVGESPGLESVCQQYAEDCVGGHDKFACSKRPVPLGVRDVIQVMLEGLEVAALTADGAVLVWKLVPEHSPDVDENPGTHMVPFEEYERLRGAARLATSSFRSICALFDGQPLRCEPSSWDLGLDLDDHPLTDVVEAAHNCALEADGSVVCWGSHQFGQLGVGDLPLHVCSHKNSTRDKVKYPCSRRPIQVPRLTRVKHLSGADYWRTCAVLEDDTVRCWGMWGEGDLTDEAVLQARSPQAVQGLERIVQIAVASRSACALHSDGQVLCFGNNDHGELGNGTTVSSERAVEVSGLTDATEIAVGNGHACAVRRDRSVWCWGYNHDGQLGDGTLETRLRPVQTLPPGSVAP